MSAISVFENRVLSKIFGPKKDEVTGGGEELYGCTPHCILFW
jgi:hypothetical protein